MKVKIVDRIRSVGRIRSQITVFSLFLPALRLNVNKISLLKAGTRKDMRYIGYDRRVFMIEEIDDSDYMIGLCILYTDLIPTDNFDTVEKILKNKKRLERKRLTKREEELIPIVFIEYLIKKGVLGDFCRYRTDNRLNDELQGYRKALLVFCKYVIDKIGNNETEKIITKCLLLNGSKEKYTKIHKNALLYVMVDFSKEYRVFER